ncbi:MAG: hypothetical protein HZC24_03885 [Rhodocyclales bacterium]|nr:hypothetical protein [Rhodocyclales bacterium]
MVAAEDVPAHGGGGKLLSPPGRHLSGGVGGEQHWPGDGDGSGAEQCDADGEPASLQKRQEQQRQERRDAGDAAEEKGTAATEAGDHGGGQRRLLQAAQAVVGECACRQHRDCGLRIVDGNEQAEGADSEKGRAQPGVAIVQCRGGTGEEVEEDEAEQRTRQPRAVVERQRPLRQPGGGGGDPVIGGGGAQPDFAGDARQQPVAAGAKAVGDAQMDGVVRFPGIVSDVASDEIGRAQQRDCDERQRKTGGRGERFHFTPRRR